MSRHTPGPWRVDISGSTYARPCVRHNGMIVCYLPRGAGGDDARLIAKAPEMYKALKELFELVDDGEFLDLSDKESTPISQKLRALLREIESG